MKIYLFFLRICAKFFTRFWWVPWSNFRYRKEERYSIDTDSQILAKIQNIVSTSSSQSSICSNFSSLGSRFMKSFEYTKDGADKLWDAVCPPPFAYSQVRNSAGANNIFKDDCDGFHSLVYHYLHTAGIECYLMTVQAFPAGHCVLLFSINNSWYVWDYYSVYTKLADSTSLQSVVGNYNDLYRHLYSNVKTDVYCNCFLEYDYLKGKFYICNPEKRHSQRSKREEQ